jgi:hypothetical protein
MRYISNT